MSVSMRRMFQSRIIRYSLSSQYLYSQEILFEDQVTLSDGRSKPYPILLQLTSKSLIIRPINSTEVSSLPRNVIIERHPITHSFGFSIKGGIDTGLDDSFDVDIEERLRLRSQLRQRESS